MEVKYTSDNKKVVVVGKLNNQQTIVQEIFIFDGNEIPSGENFVVTSLHDSPVVSWREKEIKQWEATYDRKRAEYDNLEKELSVKYSLMRAKIEYAANVLKNVAPESFETIINFLTQKFTHVVIERYYCPELLTWDEFFKPRDDNSRVDNSRLRLLSIFGRDNGSLNFELYKYSDGSGGEETFTPFTNYEDALSKFIESVKTHSINQEIINIAKKYNITLDDQKVSEWRDQKKQDIEREIKNKNMLIAKLEAELETLK